MTKEKEYKFNVSESHKFEFERFVSIMLNLISKHKLYEIQEDIDEIIKRTKRITTNQGKELKIKIGK